MTKKDYFSPKKIFNYFKHFDNKQKKYAIPFIMIFIFAIALVFLLNLYGINENFYCGMNDSIAKSQKCIDYSTSLSVSLFFLISSIIALILLLNGIFKDNKIYKYCSFGLVVFILLVSSFISIPINNSKFVYNLMKTNKIEELEYYYTKNKDNTKLINLYTDKIDKIIDNKKVSDSIQYLEKLLELKVDNELVNSTKYKIALACLNVNEEFEKGIDLFTELGNYKDSQEKLLELKYVYANKLLDGKTNYTMAVKLLDSIKTYKDSQNIINLQNNIHKYDGTWWGLRKYLNSTFSNGSAEWVFYGNTCYNVYNTEKIINDYTSYYCENDNGIKIYKNEEAKKNGDIPMFTLESRSDKLVYTYNYYSSTYIVELSKNSDSTSLPEKDIIKEPSIGMTADEVRKSTWGAPNKINKDTFSWGTTEQWVYSGYKYIYFKNGLVTSISE